MVKYTPGTLLLAALTGILSPVKAATPLVEFQSQPGTIQKVLPGETILSFYTLRNNTPKSLPLSVRASSSQLQINSQGSSCHQQLPANSSCTLALSFTAPADNQTLAATVVFDYQGRSPLISQITYVTDKDLPCQLENKADAQTAFCQQQYQNVLTYIKNSINSTDVDVLNGQSVGGMVGIYHRNGNQDQICYVSCGLRQLNGTAPDEQTVFELASVTKTFTTAILGKRVSNQSNPLNPLDPVSPSLPTSSWLGESFNLHPREQAVSFQQLATFSGGVCYSDAPGVDASQSHPDWLRNQSIYVADINRLTPGNPRCYPSGPPNVKAVYSGQFLPTVNFYSNSSVGLLAQTLMAMDGYSQMNQDDFNGFICENLTTPLEMIRTTACLPDEVGSAQCGDTGNHCNKSQWASIQFATGYKEKEGHYDPGFAFPYVPWAGAGNLRSNAEDMIIYLKSYLGFYEGTNPAVPAILKGMQRALQSNDYLPAPSGTTPRPNIGSQTPLVGGQGYAWVCDPASSDNAAICGKIGAHEHFRSFVGINRAKRYGVVILVNAGDKKPAGFSLIASPPTPAEIGVELIKHFIPE